MTSMTAGIQSKRLDLVSMSAEFLEASFSGNVAAAAKLLGTTPPEEWLQAQGWPHIRLEQLRADPSLQPWLLRAVILRSTGAMIGYVGFHTAPDPGYLQPVAPGGVEMGYTIYPAFRQQGYATEAVAALMAWAEREHGVRRFVLSISPQNLPSQRIAAHFGFRKVGSHMDEIDGLEDIYLLEVGTEPQRNLARRP
jgi:RimJ/RimL family protein N-acetyltransferase